jgi:hypothetical protein
LGCRCAWSSNKVPEHRHTHDSRSSKGRWFVNRSDRAFAADVSQYCAGFAEERQHDSAEVEWWLSNADANTYTDANSDAYADANADTYADANADTYADADTDANSDANSDADTDTYADADSDADTDANAGADCDVS